MWGGGGLTGREIRYIIRSLLSQLLTVLCLFKKCSVKVSSKHLFSKPPGWYSVRDSLLEKGVKISVKCILYIANLKDFILRVFQNNCFLAFVPLVKF